MKRIYQTICNALDESQEGQTASEISARIGKTNHSVANILASLYKQELVGREKHHGKWHYYSLKGKPTLRQLVSEETNRRHEEYLIRKKNKAGKRSYEITHIDMLRILASQGNQDAIKEIQRRDAFMAKEAGREL